MHILSRYLGRWPVALACVLALAAAVLLPGLGTFGLWEPQERQLSDRQAPSPELTDKRAPAPKPKAPPPRGKAPACERTQPDEALARTLTTRAMVWGRDNIADSDAGRRLPLALLGLLTVLASAGIAMRLARPRAGVLAALVVLSMPLLVFQSRQLVSEIGIAAGAALTLYGLVAFGTRSGPRGVLDSALALLSVIAGVSIGFVAGGALLGVLVPVGAYAVAHGLGARAVRDGARAGGRGALALAGVIQPRWVAGRDLAPPRQVVAWLELALGLASVATGLGLALVLRAHADPAMAYGLIAAGVPLALHGHYQLARADHHATIDQVKGLVAALLAAGTAGVLAYEMYSLVEPQPGLVPPQRALLGKAIVASGCWSDALGALWRPEDDLRYGYDSMFEQIAYGTFPWGILGPVAIGALLASGDRRRRAVGALTLAWAGGAWLAAEAFQRKVGFTLWAGFPALAIAIGVWLDAVFTGRRDTPRPRRDAMAVGTMLIGLFVAFAVIDIGKDLQSFPERITSLLVGSDQIPYPKTSRLLLVPTKLWLFALGTVVALGFAVAMITWRDDVRRELSRKAAQIGAAVALAGTAAFAAFWAFAWQPRLATHLSSKAMFDTYLDLRAPGDQLVIMGDLGDAPHTYAPGAQHEQVTTRDKIVEAMGRPNRVFAIAPQTELCQLHRELGGNPYFVIDDRNSRSLLLSNRVDGTTDKNPLRTAILHEEPTNIAIRPKDRIVWDNRIELLGWEIPRSVNRGEKFTVKMFYKVLQPVGGNWRILFHFDGSLRFNGDHEPIKGRCQTATWQPGDYIVDTHTVTAGGGTFNPGRYDVWTGFFTGSAPNWKNMPVSQAPPDMRDTADRVKITTIILD